MYKKIIIALLLSGYISTSTATSETLMESFAVEKTTAQLHLANYPTPRPTEKVPPGHHGTARKQIEHMFSEPVIIVIILGVMAGIIGTILLSAYVIGKLTKKRSLPVQSTFSYDTEAPLSSVETGNPET